jgi:hypothetical protein
MDLRAGLDDVEKRKFLALSGLELRPFGRPARSQSLYRKRYRGSYSEVVLVFESNNACLKKVLSEQTSDSCAVLNVMCLLKYLLSCEQHFSYFGPD